MAYGIVHRFKGGTRSSTASLAKVHPNQGADLPEGQTLHIAGRTDDGWIIVAIHDSRDSWRRPRRDAYPRMQELREAGLPGPEETTSRSRISSKAPGLSCSPR